LQETEADVAPEIRLGDGLEDESDRGAGDAAAEDEAMGSFERGLPMAVSMPWIGKGECTSQRW
jgi:hypothetical protein